MIQTILVVISWTILFFVKKLLYKVILAILQLVTRQMDFLNNKLNKVISPIANYTFPRILLNFILLVFAAFLLITEYSSLNTNMVYYFKGATLDMFPEIGLSSVISISYIAITLILGILGLELLGFRQILLGIRLEY